ncbi:hypothetical protein SCHPADRAFT_916100 [Schizopora paradoxa]|uniref:Ribosomal protein s17 n=1 Tax=Schizopora paradoxa TaxID=27342 RepID=A0A0H2RHG0_9AGAM|nr:hypothetical protein SCHPADRAFT_916100 [Schizopora paradoxa]
MMKLTSALSFLLVALPLLSSAAVTPRANNVGGFGGFGGGNNNAASSNNNNNNAAASNTSTTSTGSSSQNATANNPNAQDSLTLDPNVIATGFEQDGQETPTAGQIASATSNNNFINFCLTVPNLPITNGQQITTGSCNPAPMGVIAAQTNMPASKFTFPANGQTIAANQTFTISMALNHLEAGNFVNAEANYFAAPQTVNSAGDIVGHTHFVVEQLQALDQTTPLNNVQFTFFKGVNTPAANGVVSVDVTGGLGPGFYRLASINTAANHQPVLVAVAQHGSTDDMVYFTVSENGAAADASSAAAGAAGATATAAASSAAASSTAAAKAGSTQQNKGGNTQQQNKGGNGNKFAAPQKGGRFRRAQFAREY